MGSGQPYHGIESRLVEKPYELVPWITTTDGDEHADENTAFVRIRLDVWFGGDIAVSFVDLRHGERGRDVCLFLGEGHRGMKENPLALDKPGVISAMNKTPANSKPYTCTGAVVFLGALVSLGALCVGILLATLPADPSRVGLLGWCWRGGGVVIGTGLLAFGLAGFSLLPRAIEINRKAERYDREDEGQPTDECA